MPVKKDASGQRSIQVDIEVPGTPEEVWLAIATGPGISSWFVPAELEGRVEGTMVLHFGPGSSMDSAATITAWDPPHRFAAEGTEAMGPGASPLATEWRVEARSGGTCVVRVVQSLFTSTDEWDGYLESIESGWPAFFSILQRYLSHFRGELSATFLVTGVAPEPKEAAWQSFVDALGLPSRAGEQVNPPAGPPPLAGSVEWSGQPAWGEEVVLALDEPAPGTAHLYAMPMGDKISLSMRFYLYGEKAAAAAARAEPPWQAWMSEHFPMPTAVDATS